MINFNALPGKKPVTEVQKGCYIATIEAAEMKPVKDASSGKPPYLNMRLALADSSGRSYGKVFDIISESEQELARFKLRRFIEALAIPITGNFELRDLPKIIVGKQMLVDIAPEKRDGVLTGYSTVDISSGDIYYNLAEASRKLEGYTVNATPADNRINAPDAEDADQAY